MKRIFLALLLMLSPAVVAPAESVGELLDINGSIASVQADSNTISIGSKNYTVDDMSALTIDGKRGTIHDLAIGMKVSGSAEVTEPSSRRRVLMIRILNATSPPAGAQGTPAAAGPPLPGALPQTFFPGPATNTNPEAIAAMADLKQGVTGIFWAMTPVKVNMMQPEVSGKVDPEAWFCLNADGTVTCGWLAKPGVWSVRTPVFITISFSGEEKERSSVFAHKTLDGCILSILNGPPPPMTFKLTRIDSPTQAMRDKVPASSAQPVTAGNMAVPAVPVVTAPASTLAPSPASTSPETQNAAAGIIQANHGNLVFVTGKEGAGSGFIATLNGANFLITNAHVAAGISNADFKTLDGSAVKGGAAAVAVGHDIFCMSLPAVTGKPFEIMQGVDENAKIGDDVVVLGNADGAGVINTIMGKIVGIGPSLVEVDAQFIPGNSGSPIVHIKTGKVIGVATYLVTRKYDATTHEKMATPEVRRYGYRIDSVKTWQPVNWQVFYANADAMEKIHTLTADLDDFFRDLSENKGKVTPARHSNPVIKFRIAQWQEDKGGGRSASDRQDADANFLSFLKIACQSDINAVQGRLSYDYFQRQLSDEQETRTEISKAFTEIIQDIQK